MLRAFRKDAIAMKIESSALRMSATHSASNTFVSEESYERAFTLAASRSSLEERKTSETNVSGGSSFPITQIYIPVTNSTGSIEDSFFELKQRLLRHIIEMMHNMLYGNNFRSQSKTEHLTSDKSENQTTQVWYRESKSTYQYYCETESTNFQTKGIVTTSDGRELDFSVHLSMSRAFMKATHLEEVVDDVLTFYDPLVINLDVPSAAVTEQSFFFDIDNNGTEEKIASLAKGSGFLALDKNEDGIINDGSELFGTNSGDGFRDLAIYDDDGNGWIDENDAVFAKLKVWTKDYNGADRLLSLKEADVGAIFLGNVSTGFDLKNNANDTRARIQSTGIFLHESTGVAGTIQHVDFSA